MASDMTHTAARDEVACPICRSTNVHGRTLHSRTSLRSWSIYRCLNVACHGIGPVTLSDGRRHEKGPHWIEQTTFIAAVRTIKEKA